MKATLQTHNEINRDDIINFWMTFFPEQKDCNDLVKLFEKVSDIKLDELADTYINRNVDMKNYKKFFEESCTDEFDFIIESTLQKIKNTLRWAYFFKPILKKNLRDLYKTIMSCNIIDLDYKESIFFDLTCSIIKKMLSVAYQVIVLEINIAKRENILEGESPQNRADYFNDVLLDNDNYLKSIYSFYPELVRILEINARNMVEYLKEIIINTQNNRTELESIFGGCQNLKSLIKIEIGSGDTHNKGKSVSKLIFNDDVILIYKPRYLDLELAYEKFIDCLNHQKTCFIAPLKACKVYTKDDFGWMEYMPKLSCKSLEEARKFYRRIGHLLCIAYTLKSNDLHYENLIINASQPVLVDLETLLGQGLIKDAEDELSSIEEALVAVGESVRKSILLPTKITNRKNGKLLDIGGMAKGGLVDSPFSNLSISNDDCDNVRVIRDFGKILIEPNVPIVDEEPVYFEDNIEEVKVGFEHTYLWIMENKNQYFKKISDLFSQCSSRIVLKPTRTYYQLLKTSFHPDLLQNPLDRLVYLHRIGLLIKDHDKDEKLKDIFSSEILDMKQTDIPYFFTKANGNDLFLPSGKIIKDFYKQSIINGIKSKIDSMSKIDMSNQLCFIGNGSGYILEKNISTNSRKSRWLMNKPRKEKDFFIKQARKIGNEILSKSFVGETNKIKNRTYIRQSDEAIYGFKPVDNTVLYGNAGIAIFLFYLGIQFNEDKFKSVAIESINTIIDSFKKIKERPQDFFEVLLIIFKIGYGCANKRLRDFVAENLNLMESSVKDDKFQIFGSIIDVLYEIYICNEERKIKSRVGALAGQIFSKIQFGKLHDNDDFKNINLTQFIKLHKIVKNNIIIGLINNRLTQERCSLSKETKNIDTKDLYNMLNDRLTLIEYKYKNSAIISDIKIIANRIINLNTGKIGLHNGYVGGLAILNKCATILGDNKLKHISIKNMERFIDEYTMYEKMVCGKEFENLDFCDGLAGIGYAILCFYNSKISDLL